MLCIVLQAVLALLILFVPLPAHSQLAAPVWKPAEAQALLAYGQGIGAEGLDPSDYGLDAIRSALRNGDPAAIDGAATHSFALLAHDLAHGHVPEANRIGWHIHHDAPSAEMVGAMMAQALASGDVAGYLAALLPAHAEYRALKTALARSPAQDRAGPEKIRVNMERWRWMPRDPGGRHILVNVPAFRADLIEDGEVLSRHRVITGALKTPTPQFDAMVNGVIFNPSWYVPQSIIDESVGQLVRTRPAEAARRGYVSRRDENGRLAVRQLPGPSNSLGQVKLDMPNPFTIYLHDTPNKALFEKAVRTFSHGCIRTERIRDLAGLLLSGQKDWDMERISQVLAGRQTTRVLLAQPIPVYVAYFTAVDDGKGGIMFLDDVYGRDGAVAEALNDRRNDQDEEIAGLFRKGLSECSGVQAA